MIASAQRGMTGGEAVVGNAVHVFSSVILFRGGLIRLSLLRRPYRHHKGAIPILAYLPVVCVAEADSGVARAGAAALQCALFFSIVRPLQQLFDTRFVVLCISGLANKVRVVLGIHAWDTTTLDSLKPPMYSVTAASSV